MKPWRDMTFRQQAEMTLDNLGLSEEQTANAYQRWEELEFPDVPDGRIEALAALQNIGYEILLKSLGRWEEFDNLLNERVKT